MPWKWSHRQLGTERESCARAVDVLRAGSSAVVLPSDQGHLLCVGEFILCLILPLPLAELSVL